MHPYQMQRFLKERGKDQVLNIRQRATIYQTIQRLLRAGLITVQETVPGEKRPDRTVYALTEAGKQIAPIWLREALSTPQQEFPEFPAALAFLPLLTPEDALHQLERRAAALTAEVARLAAQLQHDEPVVPRLFLLEMEYLRAMCRSELEWVNSLISDLRAGTLDWNEAWLRAVAQPKAEEEEKGEIS